MKSYRFDQPQLFDAFVKMTQYVVRLSAQQDIWEQLGNFIMTYFPADWVAFVRRDSKGEISINHCTLPRAAVEQHLLAQEAAALITGVLDSSLLAVEPIRMPDPVMAAFLPIAKEGRTEWVLLIGHNTTERLPNDLLNVYLAIAGLVGATLERLQGELELCRHRDHLEELVRERTVELAKAERQNELILQSVGDGICGLDLDGQIAFVNRSAARLLGWNPGDLIGRGAHDTFHHTHADGCRYPAEECPITLSLRNKKTSYIASENFYRKDGASFPVECLTTPIIEADDISGTVLVFRDITERKQAEDVQRKSQEELEFGVRERTAELEKQSEALRVEIEERKLAEDALRTSENELRLITDSLPSCIAYINKDGRYQFVNKAYETWFGHPKEELLGKYAREVIGENAFQKIKDYLDAALSGEKVVYELEMPYGDGGTRYTCSIYIPDADAHGIVKGLYALTTDMTELRSMQRKVAETLEFNQRILETSPLGMVIFDSSGQCVFANDASAAISGGGKEQIRQQNFCRIASWKQAGLLDMAERVLDGGIPEHSQTHIKSMFGKEVWIEPRMSRFASGGEPHLLLVYDDITERKSGEEQIRKLNLDLMERTEELTRINKELESFSYSVSHDLRAPLRSINGFSRIILDQYLDKLDQEGQEYLQIITSECKRMGLLIDDLLSLSRLSRKEISQETADLSGMVETIAAELRRREPGRQVDFIIAPGIKATGDKVLLQSVLENLMNNAWKFTGRHPVARIEFGATEQDGKAVYFVRDDGAGFDMKYSGKLFGAFQRLHGTDEFPGNGIGLAAIQRIIHRHGGRVWAESVVEKGATFYFTLN